jgi:hypothetical protein
VKERRQKPRIPLILSTEVTELNSGTTLRGRCSDLNMTGCYIDTLHPTPKGEPILVKLVRPNGTFEAKGKVIYTSHSLGMGIQFDADIAEEQKEILKQWLEEAEKAE